MTKTFANEIDIYYETTIKKHSAEHVLQAGLGCDLLVEGLIDASTNSSFGGTIDKHITDEFAWIRNLLGLKSRRGGPIGVETVDDEYDWKGDGFVRKTSGPPWTITQTPDGISISISADTEDHAVQLARHAMRSCGLEGREPSDVQAKQVSKYIRSSLHIHAGGPLHFRAVAKSCFNLLALHLTPRKVLEDQFNPLRSYIRHAVDNIDKYCAACEEGLNNTSPSQDPYPKLACFDFRPELVAGLPSAIGRDSPLEHRIVIQGSHDTHVLYAVVQLFGSIPYSVLISDCWTGHDFCHALVADPIPGGKKFELKELNHGTLPCFTSNDVLSHEVDLNAIRLCFDRLLKESLKIAKIRAYRACMDQAFDAVFGDGNNLDGQPLTREHIFRLANEAATRWVKLHYRIDSETPVPPPKV